MGFSKLSQCWDYLFSCKLAFLDFLSTLLWPPGISMNFPNFFLNALRNPLFSQILEYPIVLTPWKFPSTSSTRGYVFFLEKPIISNQNSTQKLQESWHTKDIPWKCHTKKMKKKQLTYKSKKETETRKSGNKRKRTNWLHGNWMVDTIHQKKSGYLVDIYNPHTSPARKQPTHQTVPG